MVGQPETEVLGIHNGIIHPTLRKEFFNNDILDKSVLTTRLSELTSDRYETNQKYGLIKYWDVSRVTDMSNLFMDNSDFNEDIGGWDVSNVTNMSYMFRDNSAFNQDISGWNISSVTNVKGMFQNATLFNQEIRFWDVDNVTNFLHMFKDATAFQNQYSAPDTPTRGFWFFIPSTKLISHIFQLVTCKGKTTLCNLKGIKVLITRWWCVTINYQSSINFLGIKLFTILRNNYISFI